MRILIVFALVGVAFGETLLAEAPLAYSSYFVDRPKPSYEYATSVQTPNYNNFAHVRSGGDFERTIVNVPTASVVAEPARYVAAAPARYVAAAPGRYVAAAPARFIAAAPNFRSEYRFLPSTYFVQPNTVQVKSAPIATPILKTSIPTAIASNVQFKSTFEREAPFVAPAVALPTTRLVPVATAPLLSRIEAPTLVRSAVEATPAQIVNTVVENKVVGEGLLTRKSQYHTQNELGEATYGHREPFQAHDAIHDAAGNKFGSFSYVAPDGRFLTTDYIADENGYRVATNALPNSETAAEVIPASDVVVEAKAKSRRRRSIAISASGVSIVKSLPLVAPTPPLYLRSPIPYYSPYDSVYYPSLVRSAPWSPVIGLSNTVSLLK